MKKGGPEKKWAFCISAKNLKKNAESKNRKMLDSNMSRHEMPEQLKKNQISHSKIKKVTSPKIKKCWTKKKVGHSTSTQT